jgi:hypothetical protein
MLFWLLKPLRVPRKLTRLRPTFVPQLSALGQWCTVALLVEHLVVSGSAALFEALLVGCSSCAGG